MKINIEPALNIKNMTRYELAKRTNLTFQTIDNIYKGRTTRIDLNTLESICIVLDCTPNDILIFENK